MAEGQGQPKFDASLRRCVEFGFKKKPRPRVSTTRVGAAFQTSANSAEPRSLERFGKVWMSA